jgi:hypothetical protein
MKNWTDLGDGQWKLTISVDGDPTAPPSVFRGTREQISEKLADSAEHANKRINELRRSTNGHGSPQSGPTDAGGVFPRMLSPEDRMKTVAELSNPATVDKAVTRVMESVIGPVEDFKKDRESDRQQRQVRAAESAASQFFERTPDWHPSEHNKSTLARYVFAQRLDPTKVESYSQAFEDLTAAQLLQAKPDDNNDEPAAEGRNAPETPTPAPKVPTRYSTSIRSSDISGRPPVPSGKPHLKYTREQLANLSAADYKRLIQTDRAELERCEQYYAKNQVRRAG